MKKLSFLFALLCVSMMSWAQESVTGSSTEYLEGTAFTNGYDYSFSTSGSTVTISFTEKEGYVDLVAYLWNYTSGFAETPMNVSGSTASITLTEQTPGVTLDFACKFAYSDGMSVTKRFTYTIPGVAKPDPALTLNQTEVSLEAKENNSESGTFTIIATQSGDGAISYESSSEGVATVSNTGVIKAMAYGTATITVKTAETETYAAATQKITVAVTGYVNWDVIAWLDNGTGNTAYAEKYKAIGSVGANVNNIQPNKAEDCIHIIMPSAAFGTISLNSDQYHTEGAGLFVHLDAFTSKYTEFTVVCDSKTYTFTVYYADGTEGGSSVVPEIYDVNFALQSQGATATAKSGNNPGEANDGNEGSRWWSATGTDEAPMTEEEEHDQWWQVNLGQRRIFNTIQILWEGAWGKSFDIQISDDAAAWTTVKQIRDQNIPGPFPYLQTIELDEKKTAQYVRFQGIERGTGYSYSFWEFRVLLPNVSVLTTIDLKTATNIAKVGGEGIELTTTAKDQNGVTMDDVEITYKITPTGAGSVVDGKYIPAQYGWATIVAKSGEVSSDAIQVFGVNSDNLALSTNIETDNKVIAQSDFSPNGTNAFHAVDGNKGSVWQGSATNGTADTDADRTYDAWFVVDLGDYYDIGLVTINFEGACSQNYHVDFSADNSTWSVGYNHEGVAGVNGRTDYLTTLENSSNVHYVRFWSTKAATGWGMKMFEFEVYGTEASTTKNVSASVNDAAMGTAVVKKGDETIISVEAGTEVNFIATANDGYIFLNWTKGEEIVSTDASYTTTITSHTSLVANFRKLGSIYCNTLVQSSNANQEHDAYVTMKRTGENEYTLVVRSTEKLKTFGGTEFYMQPNTHVKNLRDQGTLSDDKRTLIATFSAEKEPYMTTPLYVVLDGNNFEAHFPQLTDIEYAVDCNDEDVELESIAFNPAELAMMVGESRTLVPIFTPIYAINKTINSWTSSNEAVATVVDGVVTAKAEGTTIITATTANGKTATCTITVAGIYYTAPTTAAPVPTWPADQVKSLYSNTYPFAPASLISYNEGWWQPPVMTEGKVEENNYLLYDLHQEGMIGVQFAETSVASMENLHIDIWASAAGTITVRPITNGGPNVNKQLTLNAQQWNSFDIPLTDFAGHDWTKLFQYAIENYAAGGLVGEYIAVDNVFFYRTTALEDSEKPTNFTASLEKANFKSVIIKASATDNLGAVTYVVKNGGIEVATMSAKSGDEVVIQVLNLTPNTNYTFTIIAKDEVGNETDPITIETKTIVAPVAAPTPDFSGKNVLPIFTDAMAGGPATIHSGGWGETTIPEWLDLTENDKVFYAQKFNFAGWHSFGEIDATGMAYLHIDFYSIGMTQVSATPISPDHEGVYNVTLTPNTWTSVDIPLSAYAANNIEWNNIFQFKFMNPVDDDELFVDNVYFWQPIATTTVDGWGTFASAGNVQVPTGVTAYKAAYSNNGGNEVLVLKELEDGIIPAGEGVLIEGAASTTYGFTSTATAPTTDMSDNDLIGTTTLTDVSAQRATSDIFCLRRTELFGTTAFCLYSGQYIPAGKAYLALPQINGQAGAPRNIRMVFNTATGIEDVQGTQVQSTKVIENGQLIIIRDGKRYNAQGARVE